MTQATAGDPDPSIAQRTGTGSGGGECFIVPTPPISPFVPLLDGLWEGLTFEQRKQIKLQQLAYAQLVCTGAASTYKAIAGIIAGG